MLPANVLDDLDLTLGLVKGWKLPLKDWTEIHRALTDLRQGITTGDADVVEQGTIAIEEMSPSRLGSLGETESDEAEPAPPYILQLVLELQRASEASRSSAGSEP
jgi:CATRA-Associated Small Protein